MSEAKSRLEYFEALEKLGSDSNFFCGFCFGFVQLPKRRNLRRVCAQQSKRKRDKQCG